MTQLELGKQSVYDSKYNPDRLFPIARQEKRTEIGIQGKLPFFGYDIWNHYEVSWLNAKGKPMVAVAEIIYACDSPFLIESKSLKLYFNSFNQTIFPNKTTLLHTIENDLTTRVGAPVNVRFFLLTEISQINARVNFEGVCLDDLDITCDTYQTNPQLLSTETTFAEETLYSNLLKSNCLITNQPDWGSVQIQYKGKKINHENLLKYLISFRLHNEFHEQCIERIFMDITTHCQPEQLTVYGRYTRRGGLDINPYRSTQSLSQPPDNIRLFRQ